MFKRQAQALYYIILIKERDLAPGSKRKEGINHYLTFICDNSKKFPDWETLN
jgi:hypothetical protein